MNDRIHLSRPLDPAENWSFWTDPKSSLLEKIGRSYPPRFMRKAFVDRMLARTHESGIEEHYDVSNDFFGLMLDERFRFYTAGEFLREGETLEEAQANKAAQMRALLKLRGDESIVDLGCGWGGMLRYLREQGHKGKLFGYTLSREQIAHCRDVVGVDARLCNFITQPFEGAPFDRIYSIESLEHVRPSEVGAFHRKVFDALVPGGLAVHQFVVFHREAYSAASVGVQLFFPGSNWTLHSEVIGAAKGAGFRVLHDQVIDYTPTFKAWHDRLGGNREKAVELVGVETYNRYLTLCAVGWMLDHTKEGVCHRFVFERPA